MTPRFIEPTRRYSGYVFDCDGTLADTMLLHHRAWRSALEQAGASFDFDWDMMMSRAGMSLEQTVSELSAQFDFPLDPVGIAAHQRVIYGSLENTVRGVEEVVSFARRVAEFAPLAVASGSHRPHVVRTLETLGIAELFSVIVTPEDVAKGRGKPEPDMFLLAAARMGVPPSECLVLEDAEFGFEAARRAGMDYAVVGPPLAVSSEKEKPRA
jgi:beta-phosphoglucomutase-like phosphatase (HAD superfamily)